jgi:hypothetical protein
MNQSISARLDWASAWQHGVGGRAMLDLRYV